VRRLRVGCVGTGFIAGRHLAALAGFPDVDVVAVADVRAERAAEAAARCGARPYDDGLALLATEDLDAVWLCVPPFAHGPLEAAAVDRGLPFFVEKPLAADLAGAQAVAARLAGSGLVTAVGYHWRHLDLVHRAAEVLARTPAHLVTACWWDRTPGVPWWAERDLSGGQVVEQTTHLFDLARHLVGEVRTVTAIERAAPGATGDVPAVAGALLRFTSGAVGTVTSARVLGRRHAVVLQAVADGVVVEVSERGISDHELRIATAEGEEVLRSDQDPIAVEDREFLDVLLGRAAGVRVPYEEALRSHALACAADRSARDGGPADLAGAGD